MRKLITLTLSALLLSPVAFAAHGEEHTFDKDVTIKVNGLVCDFCATALEKTFGKRDEVNAIHVDLDNGEVTIDLKNGQTIPDEELTGLITDAGYNVTEIIKNPHE